jgi:tetratricopeptide (TPR) repeat protein
MTDAALLQHRLATFRRTRTTVDRVVADDHAAPTPARGHGSVELAERLAAAIDGEVVATTLGLHVRREPRSIAMPIDRDRLATLPGQPPAHVPLLCLDTETTGLATAAGTVAFLLGLGWWDGDRFRQLQLLLPDHSDEAALLDALALAIPSNAWLVTYNGRGFDWPLLVTRFRMARRGPPIHDGHLDLLPTVRRLFRHRLPDARLRTVEQDLLGIHRIGDVEGWEIPGRYHAFLRGASAETLSEVVHHNELDVVSLARLLGHLDERLGDRGQRQSAPAGDLAGLARGFAALRRHDQALECLDWALERIDECEPDRWAGWTPNDAGPAGGERHGMVTRATSWPARARAWSATPSAPIDRDRIEAERARLLRRMGDLDGALSAWRQLADRGSRLSALGCVEMAKIEEHQRRDPSAALRAVRAAETLADRSRRLGRPLPFLEADLEKRRRRLQQRLAPAGRPGAAPSGPEPSPRERAIDRSAPGGQALRHAPAYR